MSAISLALAVTGCASPVMSVPKKLEFERTPLTDTGSVLGEQQVQRKYSEADAPATPRQKTSNIGEPTPQTPTGIAAGKDELSVSFNQMPLPTFINAVYGGVLKTNFSVDAAVSSRTDLITFRTPKPQTPAQMANLARMLLKSYGVAVQDFGGVIRIVPDNASNSYSPQIKRGRAQPDTPISLRPVFHYVELEAVRVGDFSNFVRTMFGTKIQMTDDGARNALLISGQPEDVAAALEVVQVFDQPSMRGQRSKRVSPAFWTADEFSKRLTDVLVTEGYSVSNTTTAGTPIVILPIAPLNSVIIFASSEPTLKHILKWAQELDRPSESQAGGTYFTYPVKYADAQALAKTLTELIGGGSSAATPLAAGATPAAPAARGAARIVVNNATNTLIIKGGGPDEYRQWMVLLAELDKPTKSALIDVMVAEVTAGTANKLGVSWNFRDRTTAQRTAAVGEVTGGSAGPGGLIVNFFNTAGLIRADLSALATTDDASILSSPKIMARNGETATIQVGDEVPILTSTTTVPGSILSASTITNTVQYRTTGVILKVRPVINSGNRIDLDISQEVSSAKVTETGVASSPTISNRKIDTKLTLRDGSTVMLAGLISNDDSFSNSGVPGLKDIPLLGSLFKRETRTHDKKELIILITPYIINDDFEAESITNAFQSSLGGWAKELKEHADTGNLKRTDTLSPAPESGNQRKPAAITRPSEDAAQTPAQEKTSEAAAPTTTQDDDTESSGVIMSKPEVPPTPAAKAPTTGKTADNKADSKAGNQGATSTPPVKGKAVEDANLLDELRRAVEKR